MTSPLSSFRLTESFSRRFDQDKGSAFLGASNVEHAPEPRHALRVAHQAEAATIAARSDVVGRKPDPVVADRNADQPVRVFEANADRLRVGMANDVGDGLLDDPSNLAQGLAGNALVGALLRPAQRAPCRPQQGFGKASRVLQVTDASIEVAKSVRQCPGSIDRA